MQNGYKVMRFIPENWLHCISIFCATIGISFFLIFANIPHNLHLKEGDVAPKTIFSPRYIEVLTSQDKTNLQQSKIVRLNPSEKVYTIDDSINQRVIQDLRRTFESIKVYQRDHLMASSVPLNMAFLSPEQLKSLAALDSKSVVSLEYFSLQIMDSLLAHGVIHSSKLDVMNVMDSSIDFGKLSSSEKELSLDIIMHNLRPNMTYNESKTHAMDSRLGNDLTYTTKIKEGEPIIYKGETVNAGHLEVFRALRVYGVKPNWFKLCGIFLSVGVLLILLERFVYYFNPRVYEQHRNVVLLYLVLFCGVLTASLVQFSTVLPFEIEHVYLIPIPIAAMLISMLLRTNISLLAGSILAVYISIMFQMDFGIFLYLFLSNSVALFVLYKKYSRRDVILGGYMVGALNAGIVIIVGLLTEHTAILWFVSNSLVACLNGIVASMVSLAILPYFETLFGITTRQTLLDFSNLNHPILKQLMVSAPGTYQHSVMVANLAEAGAEVVNGADPVLCRVGAYFHDIGKMKRPNFFTENQLSGHNPHEDLTPRMSKMIISSHVKDGVDLATKHRLPNALKQIIWQHHGTSLVSFFYIQALHATSGKDVGALEEDFRYAGPRPNFKESGIVMLADSVEAATRSLEKPSFSKVENMVEKVFRDKIDDHQLDDCPLSLREIELIKETFLKLLKGIYHSRIDYREQIEKFEKD